MKHAWAWPLSGMLLTQTAGVMALVAVPVLATEIGRESGLAASTVGVYTALIFAAAMLMSVASGPLIKNRFGPIRANQAGLLVCACGVLLALTANPWIIALGAVVVGLGYGPNTPAGSQVLAHVTPPERRGLVFSIKQSGAPAGALLGGLVLPWIVVLGSWQWALAAAAAFVCVAAVAVEPLRRRIDLPRGQAGAGPSRSPFVALARVLEHPPLRALTLGGFAMVIAHACYQTFLVAFLVEEAGLALTTAGALYATVQGAGALSRVVFGWSVDRRGASRGTLVGIALLGAASTTVVALFGPHWPLPVMWMVCVLAGIGSAGWYGVFLADVARLAPDGDVALATGGALFFVYFGLVAGPLAFSLIVAGLGSYPTAFFGMAALSGAAAWCFRSVR